MNKPVDDFDTIMERAEFHLAECEQLVSDLTAWLADFRARQAHQNAAPAPAQPAQEGV